MDSGCGDIEWIVNGQIVGNLAEAKGEYSVMSIDNVCSITNKSYGCVDCMNLSESVRISSSLEIMIMSNATLTIECIVVQNYHTRTFRVVRRGYIITVQQSECGMYS